MISAKERTVAKGITASGVGMGESWPRMQSAATVCAPSDKICHHRRVYPKAAERRRSGWIGATFNRTRSRTKRNWSGPHRHVFCELLMKFGPDFAPNSRKEYADLASSAELEYLVLACEEGGRWGPDQFRLVRDLVRLKVAPIHPLLRRSAALGYTRRWWHILSLGAQTVAADCILGHDSPIPAPETVMPLATVLSLAEITPESSRLA